MHATRAERRSISQKFAEVKAAGRIGLISFIPAGISGFAGHRRADQPWIGRDRPSSKSAFLFPIRSPTGLSFRRRLSMPARKVKIADVFATVAGVRDEVVRAYRGDAQLQHRLSLRD